LRVFAESVGIDRVIEFATENFNNRDTNEFPFVPEVENEDAVEEGKKLGFSVSRLILMNLAKEVMNTMRFINKGIAQWQRRSLSSNTM
jgi:hypothetical protein